MGTFVVFRKPGTGWVSGKVTREQPGWDAHAEFMDELHASGRVILAGPYDDLSRVVLIVRCSSVEEVDALFETDPWTAMGILESDGVHPWTAFLKPDGWPA